MMRNLLRKFLFTANGKTILINGEKIHLPEKFISHFNVRRDNPMEPELYKVMKKLIRPGHVFVDIGANVGIFSLLASRVTGASGKVFVVEPNPSTFDFLSDIISANKKHDNFIKLQLAVSDKLGVLPLQLNEDESILMERASIIHREQGSRTVEVVTNTLDRIIPMEIHPNIIKIDVEGAELSVLNGCYNIIKIARPIFCVEVHGLYFTDAGRHVSSVFDFFQMRDYKAVNIFKQAVEDARSFLLDSGAPGIDVMSGKPLRGLGYGNLIFYPEEQGAERILDACNILKR